MFNLRVVGMGAVVVVVGGGWESGRCGVKTGIGRCWSSGVRTRSGLGEDWAVECSLLQVIFGLAVNLGLTIPSRL